MSKTKEEIVREEYEKVFMSPKYDQSVNRQMNLKYFAPAIDAWAKQQAIAFTEWVNSHYYECYVRGYYSELPKSFTPIGTGHTLKQLYDIFISETTYKEK